MAEKVSVWNVAKKESSANELCGEIVLTNDWWSTPAIIMDPAQKK
jgi:hypothetical protein